ncbi:MAG TPA: GNAT family N-acetyltransferase [Microbacterium sp.]|nr:GNAT family N-acetyltransferase [Microbacterium sp.]
MDLTVTPLDIPERPDDADWRAYIDIVNASYSADSGDDMLVWHADVTLAAMRDQRYTVKAPFLAWDDGTPIGAGIVEFDRSTARDVDLSYAVLASRRGRGVADALLERLEREAAAIGRTNAQTTAATAVWPDSLDERDVLRPSSGFGGMPRDDENVRTLLARGYALGQVERASAYRADADPGVLQSMLAAATARAGSDYEPVWWSGATPDEHVDAYAYAVSRMATDVPSGDLDWEEAAWDAERIRAREARVERTGQLWLVAAVVHRPTGRIVAFNELVVPPDRTQATENYGTLVLREHRGRRLGTIVKCLGLLRWREVVPTSPAVFTFNAEENRYMLDVNEAVGFRPVFWEGGWQKELTSP